MQLKHRMTRKHLSQIMNKRAFTLMEVMVVVIIIGILAGFALPIYTESLRKAHEKEIVAQLLNIHTASKIYFAHADEYWDPAPKGSHKTTSIADINDELSLSIRSPEFTFEYATNAAADIFTVTATYTGGNTFKVEITDENISASNPCCGGGSCPTLPDC